MTCKSAFLYYSRFGVVFGLEFFEHEYAFIGGSWSWDWSVILNVASIFEEFLHIGSWVRSQMFFQVSSSSPPPPPSLFSPLFWHTTYLCDYNNLQEHSPSQFPFLYKAQFTHGSNFKKIRLIFKVKN